MEIAAPQVKAKTVAEPRDLGHVAKGKHVFGWKVRHFVYKVYFAKDPTSQIVKWYHVKCAEVATLKLEGPSLEKGNS